MTTLTVQSRSASDSPGPTRGRDALVSHLHAQVATEIRSDVVIYRAEVSEAAMARAARAVFEPHGRVWEVTR